MSTEAEMAFFEGERTLRNKDYITITITRSEYKRLCELKENVEALKQKERLLYKKEYDLVTREKKLKRVAQGIKFQVHKDLLEYAKKIIKDEVVLEGEDE